MEELSDEWIKWKDYPIDWAIHQDAGFCGPTNPIIRKEAPDGSSILVSRIANFAPTSYWNILVLDNIPIIETRWVTSKWSGISDAVFDEAKETWSGTCKRGHGGMWRWEINVAEKKMAFEKLLPPDVQST